MVFKLGDGACEVCPVTFLLVGTNNADTDHCPACWQGSIFLTEPLSFIDRLKLAKSVESPKPILRNKFISWIDVSMDSKAERGTPNA